MRPQKAQKIDLNTEYPCPCRRRGHLLPITLTEAFGCDRCQQIFVLQNNGQAIEQLSSHYPYKRAWRWTGNRWRIVNSNWRESYLPVASVIVVLLIVWLPLTQIYISSKIILWATIILLLIIFPALMIWLAYRH